LFAREWNFEPCRFLASTYSPYTPHGMKVRRVEKSKGYYELIVEGYDTSAGKEAVESSITVTIPSAYACGTPPKTQIDFGPCRIKITPDLTIPPPPGSLSVACRVDILDSEGKVMDSGARATVLSHVGMTEAAFQLFGRQVLYTFNNNMAKANIIMEGTVVSKNRHNSSDLTEDRCYFDAGDQFKGYINVGWSPDYMASMVYIEGTDFKVHKVSSREVR